MSHPIDFCGEGTTDSFLARRLIEHVQCEPGIDYVQRRGPRGKDAFDRRLHGFLIGVRHGRRMLLLRDLDQDEPCAVALFHRLVPNPMTGLCLRICVRTAEAWLLADREGIASALSVPVGIITRDPEALLNSKAELRRLGQQSARGDVRRALGGSPQLQAGWTANFITDRWNIARASQRAPSLARALRALKQLGR